MIKVFVRIAVLLVIMSEVCMAANETRFIPKSEVALGGIQLGATTEHVKSVYGEPTRIRIDKRPVYGDAVRTHENVIVWEYGSTLTFKFEPRNEKVYYIETTGNNGIKTPSGFSVGDKLVDVCKYFENKFHIYPRCLPYQTKEPLKYYDDLKISYECAENVALIFTSDGNGKILQIIVGDYRYEI